MDHGIDAITGIDRVHLSELPPLTTLLVWTTNSLYRVVVAEGANVYVQGGLFFPDPTSAHVDGASVGGRLLMVGWIGVGLLIEFHFGNNYVVTSPVLAITTERSGQSVVH